MLEQQERKDDYMKAYFVINKNQYMVVAGINPPQEFRPSVIITDVPCYDKNNENYKNGMLIFPVSDGIPVSIDLNDNKPGVHGFNDCDSGKVLFDFIIED